MVSFDLDALVCDLAEAYHIFDVWDYSLNSFNKKYDIGMIATLATGLRDDSRIKMGLSDQAVTLKDTLMAMIVDNTNWLVWSKTKDAEHNRNRPKSVLDMLIPKPKNTTYRKFDSPNDFLEYRKKIMNSQ